MNETEKQLFNSYRKLLENDVDPIAVTDGLFHGGYFSGNQRRNVYRISGTYQNRQNVWNALYLLIPSKCGLSQFLSILLQAGYTEIAMEIGQKWRMAMPESTQVCRVHRTKTGDSSQRFAQKLFMNFKINTHNNAFINPRQYCHEESQKYKMQLERYSDGNDEIRRSIADKYAACLLAEIDSHIMLYTRQFPTCDLIKQLKKLIPETSNSNITQLSYESRIAMACALAGKEAEGEEHLQNAMSMSLFVGRCVEISNLLYIYVFNLLSLYEKCPTKNMRDKIIHIAELGLQSIDEEDEPIREFWVRIFILRIIYCLLGLSYRGDPIYGISVDKFSVRRAKQLLTEVDRLWKGMESRRKIMYYVAKARVAELERNEGYLDTVLYFLNLAIKIGNEGEYGETQYVKLYASYFKPLKLFHEDKSNRQSSDTIVSQPEFHNESHKIKISSCIGSNNKEKTSYSNLGFMDGRSRSVFELQYQDETNLKSVKGQGQIQSRIQEAGRTEPKSQENNNFQAISLERDMTVLESSLISAGVSTADTEAWGRTHGEVKMYDTVPKLMTLMDSDDTVLKSLNIYKTDETVIKSRTATEPDDTCIKSSSSGKLDETSAKSVITDDTDGKSPNDETVVKSFNVNTNKKLLNQNTVLQSTTSENTCPKSLTESTFSKSNNTCMKSFTKIDNEETFVKSSMSSKKNEQTAENQSTIRKTDNSSLESLPFHDIHFDHQ